MHACMPQRFTAAKVGLKLKTLDQCPLHSLLVLALPEGQNGLTATVDARGRRASCVQYRPAGLGRASSSILSPLIGSEFGPGEVVH